MSFLGKLWHLFLEIFQAIVIGGSIFLIVHFFFLRIFEVSGNSMFPTFKNEEKVFTDLITPKFTPYQRGDVVVFESPIEKGKDYIKRIIGFPGNTVSIQAGKIYLNGNLLDERAYLASDVYTTGNQYLTENQTITVPDGQFFVVGDNRGHSSDSRTFGPIKQSAIIGKSWLVFFPFNAWRFVENPFTN